MEAKMSMLEELSPVLGKELCCRPSVCYQRSLSGTRNPHLPPEILRKGHGKDCASPSNSLSQPAAFSSSYLLGFHCLTRQCQNKFSPEGRDLYSL